MSLLIHPAGVPVGTVLAGSIVEVEVDPATGTARVIFLADDVAAGKFTFRFRTGDHVDMPLPAVGQAATVTFLLDMAGGENCFLDVFPGEEDAP